MSNMDVDQHMDLFRHMADSVTRGYFGRAVIDGASYMAYTAIDQDGNRDYVADGKYDRGTLDMERRAAFQHGDWEYVTLTLSKVDDVEAELERQTLGGLESDADAAYVAEVIASLYAEMNAGRVPA